VANHTKGSEDIYRPFAARRHPPGTNAGQFRTGYSAVSFAMHRSSSLVDAARIAINRFGVPRRIVSMVLRDPKRNNVKLMRLVELGKQYAGRLLYRRDVTMAKVCGGTRSAKAFKQSLLGR